LTPITSGVELFRDCARHPDVKTYKDKTDDSEQDGSKNNNVFSLFQVTIGA
jgi:hypothetical protein